MPLTPKEQAELDQLEYEKLLAEKAAAQPQPEAPAPAPAQPQAPAPVSVTGDPRLPFINGAPVRVDTPPPPGAGAFLGGLAARGGAPAVGQAVGAATGPAAPVAVPVLGGLGGMAGEAAAQYMEGGGFKPGAILAAGAMGAIPGAPMAGAGARAVGREALKQGAANLGAAALQTGVDQGRLPTAGEATAAAGLGALSPVIGRGLDAGIQARKVALEKLRTQVPNENLAEGIAAGYKITPQVLATALNKKSAGAVNDTLQTVGGLAATNAAMSLDNQRVTNRLAAEALGLPPNTPLRRGHTITGPDGKPQHVDGTLDIYRKQQETPYKTLTGMAEQAKRDKEVLDSRSRLLAQNDHELEIINSDPKIAKERAELALKAGADVNKLKTKRHEAAKAFEKAMRDGDPEARKSAMALRDEAAELENKIEEAAQLLGQPTLLKQLQIARKNIAMSYAVENALDHAGNVSAPTLGRMLDMDVPLSDQLLIIARFEQTAGKVMRESRSVASPFGGQAKAGMAAGMSITGGVGTAMTGNLPAAAAASAAGAMLPYAASSAAIRAMASGPYQRTMMNPASQAGMAVPDAASQFARFATQSIGRPQEPNSFVRFLSEAFPAQKVRPIPYTPEPPQPEPVTPIPYAPEPGSEPQPKKQARSFKEGKIYKDPETGERRRFRNGELVPV